MKIIYIILIIIGLIALGLIFAISAMSEEISDLVKTIGFITLGYIGLILFAYGWMKLFKRK